MVAHSSVIAGIDPGKTGAMVIIHADGTPEAFRVPLMKKTKTKTEPAWSQWGREWADALTFAGVDMIVIESVHARPGQGVTSMFNFGKTLGFVHALAIGFGKCPVHHPTPSVWKAKMGLTNANKDASREEARRLYPALAPELVRVKDDGVAEAALLADYGRQFL